MIGGYTPSKPGGIDWMAVTKARMMGWKTRSFRERCFYHHRVLGTANHNKIGKALRTARRTTTWEDILCGRFSGVHISCGNGRLLSVD